MLLLALLSFLLMGWLGSLIAPAIGWPRLVGFLIGAIFHVFGIFVLLVVWAVKAVAD